MIGEQVDERRKFTWEERQQILKENYGICACCGKKLTSKTLRVEHIIPLSRGGKNEMRNLTALCEECNKWKDNKIYMPCDFYAALRHKPRIREIEDYVREWFKTIKDDFDLERFPMISFNIFIQLDPVPNSTRRKPPAFNRQLMYKWSMVGESAHREMEKRSGLSIPEIRRKMRGIKCSEKLPPKNHPIPLYCLRKVSTEKMLAVIAVMYWKGHGLVMYIPWHCMSNVLIRSVVYNFVYNLLTSLDMIADQSIQDYCICSEDKETMEAFLIKDTIPELIGTEVQWGYYEGDDGSRFYMTQISRRPKIIGELRPSGLERKK